VSKSFQLFLHLPSLQLGFLFGSVIDLLLSELTWVKVLKYLFFFAKEDKDFSFPFHQSEIFLEFSSASFRVLHPITQPLNDRNLIKRLLLLRSIIFATSI